VFNDGIFYDVKLPEDASCSPTNALAVGSIEFVSGWNRRCLADLVVLEKCPIRAGVISMPPIGPAMNLRGNPARSEGFLREGVFLSAVVCGWGLSEALAAKMAVSNSFSMIAAELHWGLVVP